MRVDLRRFKVRKADGLSFQPVDVWNRARGITRSLFHHVAATRADEQPWLPRSQYQRVPSWRRAGLERDDVLVMQLGEQLL